MPTLAEIAVKLTANTTEFISGFGSAGVSAKRFRADLSEHIGAVGAVMEQGLAQFGEFGEAVGGVLGRASSAAAQAVVSFGKLGGGLGIVAGVGAGVAAALLTAEAGIIGIAIHTAESAAKLGEMSEKAGVSTQTLAGLALAGRGVGVETEALVKSLGFMNNSAVKAALAADFSKTAYGRLGIAVKDSSGQVRDSGAIFLDAVGKISGLPTTEQGYFVRQLFGRGGLEILPLINKGVDGVREKMELANQFGLGDPAAIASSRQFKETIDDIKAGFEGVALQLTKELLPALEFVAEKFRDAFKSGKAQDLIHDIAEVTKATIALGGIMFSLGDAIVSFFKNIGGIIFAELKGQEQFGNIGESIAASLKKGDYKGALSGAKDALHELVNPFSSLGSDVKKDVTSAASFARGVFDATAKASPAAPKAAFQPDLTPAKEDTTLARVKERVAALLQEQSDWADTAKAATEAETLISKAVQKGNEAFGKLKTEAARDKTGSAEKFIAQQEAQIKAAAASVFYDQTVVKTNEELDKQADTLTQTDKAALSLGAAYKQGGEAIAGAALDKQFAKEAAAVAELAGVRNVAALTAKLERNEALARKTASDDLSTSISKESHEFEALKPFVDALNLSFLQGEDAVRKARIELELHRFAEGELAKGIVVTTQQLEQKRKVLTDADKQAYDGALAQEAAQFSISAQYDNQIVKLQRIKELMQQQGVSTLGVEAQIFDEQNRLIHQWDEWAFKVGTFKEKFTAVMGELVIQGRNAGAAISNAFLTAIDGVETSLAKLLTGQKTNFKAVFQNLAESVTKAEIQKGVGKIAEHFGLKIPGLGPKADGSESNPFYVVMKNATGPASVPFGQGNPFGGFGLGSDANPNQQSGGGFLSTISSFFGGFRAMGGDMSPGKWYIAGEHGPEPVFGGKNGGRVFPNSSFGGQPQVTQHFHYASSGDRDIFGFTDRQNAAKHARNMRMAYSR